MSKVYLLRAGDTNHYKIGFTTKDPHERLSALQTGNPLPLQLVTSWQGTPSDERRLHGLLEPYRREGEWFELTIANLLTLLAQYEVVQELSAPEKDVLSEKQVEAGIKRDIHDLYLEHGPNDDDGQIEVSSGYQNLLRSGILHCRIWEWYDLDELYQILPFEKSETRHGVRCFSHCLEEGYIQEKPASVDKYRIDPRLSDAGYEYFWELADIGDETF